MRRRRHVPVQVGRRNEVDHLRQFGGSEEFIELLFVDFDHFAGDRGLLRLGEPVVEELFGRVPEGAAEHERDDGGDGGETGEAAPGEAQHPAGGLVGRLPDDPALVVGEGDFGPGLQFRGELGGEGADFLDGGPRGGIGAEAGFDGGAFGGGAFAEGVGGQLDFIARLHGRAPRIGRPAGGGFGCRRG